MMALCTIICRSCYIYLAAMKRHVCVIKSVGKTFNICRNSIEERLLRSDRSDRIPCGTRSDDGLFIYVFANKLIKWKSV